MISRKPLSPSEVVISKEIFSVQPQQHCAVFYLKAEPPNSVYQLPLASRAAHTHPRTVSGNTRLFGAVQHVTHRFNLNIFLNYYKNLGRIRMTTVIIFLNYRTHASPTRHTTTNILLLNQWWRCPVAEITIFNAVRGPKCVITRKRTFFLDLILHPLPTMVDRWNGQNINVTNWC